MNRLISAIFVCCLLAGCGQRLDHAAHGADHSANDRINNAPIHILAATELEWSPLNPARGAQGPQAATLWGDRKAQVATGFLVSFVDGFSSPPHIHNVSYRGIVIAGLLHNDAPGAAQSWMPEGSYWTQPAGAAHITSASGEPALAFIEIDQGPYLVRPPTEAFDNGERAFNTHVAKVRWREDGKVQIARLWQDKAGQVGSMLKFQGALQLTIDAARLVVIAGELSLKGRNLSPGSAISSALPTTLKLACAGEASCILYLKSAQPFAPARPSTD